MVPNIPVDADGEVAPGLSSDWGDLGDSPKPLVRREKVDFPEFPEGESSCGCDPVNGWGIFRFFAQVEIPEAENFDGASRSELVGDDSTGVGGLFSADLRSGAFVESEDSELIFTAQIPDQKKEFNDKEKLQNFKRSTETWALMKNAQL